MTQADNKTKTDDGASVPAVVSAATIDIVDSAVFQRFLAAGEDDVAELNSDEMSVAIIARILNATSIEDVLGGGSAIHARDYLDTPFALTGVRFNQSDFEGGGPQFYSLLEGANRDGEAVAITCGARNVIAQAWKLRDMGALPLHVVIRESERTTRAGYKVMWLDAAPADF